MSGRVWRSQRPGGSGVRPAGRASGGGADGPSPALYRVMLWLASVVVAGTGAVLRVQAELAIHWWEWGDRLLAVGAMIWLAGWLRPSAAWRRWVAGLALALAVFLGGLLLAEAAFRLANFDFDRKRAAREKLAPFYRRPCVRTGEVFWRREGPLEWRGRPMTQTAKALGLVLPEPLDEPERTVRYDAEGFRNEPPLKDWEVAVAGDSFVELGHLPCEELWTTLLARRLGCRVRNLGVSNTGQLSHLHYLRAYGLAPSTRRVAVVFYEGNDWTDLRAEWEVWERFRETGRRPVSRLKPQDSLLRALGRWLWQGAEAPRPPRALVPDAFLLVGGQRLPVSLEPCPPAWDELPPATREALGFFLREYGAWVRAHGLEGWLLYAPVKNRVWAGSLEPAGGPRRSEVDCGGAGSAAELVELAEAAGLRFLDLTPALREAWRREGARLYNRLWDTHWTAEGCRVVADAVAATWGGGGGSGAAWRRRQ
ncbi:MAG: hypothetical protein D6766_05315 [Verrucomicrobia bacterium]|nr:MAG: hypothetical protein D6766_05315 [Verrucomicrobiota bacterium]